MLSFWWRFLSIMDKYVWKSVDYDKMYWAQCVDFVKQFALEQYWVRLDSFLGSAYSWWITWNAFDKKQWDRVVYQKWLVPEIGDILFLDKIKSNPYGHVCVVDNNCTKDILCVIEENAGNGNGDGKWWNAVTRRSFWYNSAVRWKCLWWFHKK